jgi:hypothetical protein
MISFLPLWILGVPVLLTLIDLMATRSATSDDVEHEVPRGRDVGTPGEWRRGEESSPVFGRPSVVGERRNRNDTPVNVS